MIRLLKTRVIQQETTTLAQCLAAEATFTGYAPAQMLNYSGITVSLNNPAQFDGQATFSTGAAGGTGSILGYFGCDPAATILFFQEDLSAVPISVPFPETLTLDIAIQLNHG